MWAFTAISDILGKLFDMLILISFTENSKKRIYIFFGFNLFWCHPTAFYKLNKPSTWRKLPFIYNWPYSFGLIFHFDDFICFHLNLPFLCWRPYAFVCTYIPVLVFFTVLINNYNRNYNKIDSMKWNHVFFGLKFLVRPSNVFFLH